MECITRPKHRRILSCGVYTFLYFVCGFDLMIRASQVVFYLKDIDADNIPFYQGVLTVAALFVGTICAVVSGFLCDKYGKARLWVTISNCCGFIGTALYSIPSYPYVMILAQVVNGGMSGGFLAVATAEMARMFDGQNLTRVLSISNIGLACGCVAGPLTNFALVNVNVKYGWFFIKPSNAPGFVTCGLLAVSQLIVSLFLFNSETVYDKQTAEEETQLLKAKETTDKHQCKKNSFTSSARVGQLSTSIAGLRQTTLWNNTKLLLSNKDLLLLYLCTLTWTFIVITYDAILPLVAVEWMGFNGTLLSISYIVTGLTYVVFNTAFVAIQPKINDFYTTFAIAAAQLCFPGLLLLIYFLQSNGKYTTSWYYVWVIITSSTWLLEDVLTRSLCSKLVPLEMQGFAEGVRTIPRGTGLLLGGLFVSVWFDYVIPVSCVMLTIQLFVLLAFLYRREQLISPVRMDIGKYRTTNGTVLAPANIQCHEKSIEII